MQEDPRSMRYSSALELAASVACPWQAAPWRTVVCVG